MAESMAYADFKENGSEAACKVSTNYGAMSIRCAHVHNYTPANFLGEFTFIIMAVCLSVHVSVRDILIFSKCLGIPWSDS